MPDLARFQTGFAAALSNGGGHPALAIYRNTSARGAIEALAANYPTVRELLGGPLFENLAGQFARDFPPRGPVLALYGAGFADFLEEQGIATELPYLSDVARIDRLHIEAFLSADAAPLDLYGLRAIAPEGWTDLKLKLHPAVRFAWFTSPAMRIWLAHRRHEELVEMTIAWAAEGALFVRPFDAVEAHPIGRAAHRLLFGIRLGDTVGDSAIATLALYPDADIGALFASLAALGLFASV